MQIQFVFFREMMAKAFIPICPLILQQISLVTAKQLPPFVLERIQLAVKTVSHTTFSVFFTYEVTSLNTAG